MGLYHFIDRRWASNSMELKLSSHLALSVSYPVETFRHDSITYSEGVDFDLPRGRNPTSSFTGLRRVDKEGSSVLRVSPISDLEGT